MSRVHFEVLLAAVMLLFALDDYVDVPVVMADSVQGNRSDSVLPIAGIAQKKPVKLTGFLPGLVFWLYAAVRCLF